MTHKRIFIYCIIGTVLEWYDFAIFGVLSPILSQIFFPHKDKTTALLITLAIFATGFIMRPLGGIFFGHIGDKYGRKKAVILSVMMMTVATVAMGLLPIIPNHALFIVVLLVMLRMLQGFCVSGELAGVATFLSEMVREKKHFFFYQSFIYSGETLGILLGSIIGGVAFSFYSSYAFSWRIPFLLSFLLGISGLYLRLKAVETPIFQQMMASKTLSKLPIATIAVKHKAKVLLGLVMVTPAGLIGYFIVLAYPVYINHIHGKQAFFSIQIMMLSLCILTVPIFSYFANRQNAIIFLQIGFSLFAILTLPLLLIVTYDNQIVIMALIGIILAVLISSFRCVLGTTICLLFPHQIRYSGVAIVFNIVAVFGGFFPLVSTALTNATGNLLASGTIISMAALAVVVILFRFRRKIVII